MSTLKISGTKDYFERDGRGFFYLADTIWSAFTNVPLDEWEEYLDYRRMQGFNVLQISILPITKDASESVLEISPFELNENGKFDYGRINHKYFDRAVKMLDMAVKKGFIPALVLLWLDYVPDNWGSKRDPELIMSLESVRSYTEYVVNKFEKFNPVYLVSGDTNFESQKTTDHYMAALKILKRLTPDSLTTMHLCGGNSSLPDEFINSDLLDFYMYQSSHGFDSQFNAYKLAEDFMSKTVKRPVLNGEPCYEGHGHGGRYGRFNEFDVRKALWQSILSGAKAGITYGAHGIWSWHKKHLAFINEVYSSTPYDWRAALRLRGAWDYSFAKWLFESWELFDIEPVKVIENDTEEIRASVSKDRSKIVVYVPYNTNVRIKMDLTGYDFSACLLSEKLFTKPVVDSRNGTSEIKMHDFNSDILLLGKKKIL